MNDFHPYTDPVDFEDGEAQSENPDDGPGASGDYLGAQMAGFNVETPLGLIEHLPERSLEEAYVRRCLVEGRAPLRQGLSCARPQEQHQVGSTWRISRFGPAYCSNSSR